MSGYPDTKEKLAKDKAIADLTNNLNTILEIAINVVKDHAEEINDIFKELKKEKEKE